MHNKSFALVSLFKSLDKWNDTYPTNISRSCQHRWDLILLCCRHRQSTSTRLLQNRRHSDSAPLRVRISLRVSRPSNGKQRKNVFYRLIKTKKTHTTLNSHNPRFGLVQIPFLTNRKSKNPSARQCVATLFTSFGNSLKLHTHQYIQPCLLASCEKFKGKIVVASDFVVKKQRKVRKVNGKPLEARTWNKDKYN